MPYAAHESLPLHRPSPGGVSSEPGTPVPPAPVRWAFTLWVLAVAAGAFETVLAVGRMLATDSGSGSGSAAVEIGTGLAIRVPVFTAAVLIAVRMRRGRGWARVTLALGLGVLGTASMVVQPIQAVAQGHSLSAAIEHAGAMDIAFGVSRTLHVTAVLTAVALMFLPAANAYFHAHRRSAHSRPRHIGSR